MLHQDVQHKQQKQTSIQDTHRRFFPDAEEEAGGREEEQAGTRVSPGVGLSHKGSISSESGNGHISQKIHFFELTGGGRRGGRALPFAKALTRGTEQRVLCLCTNREEQSVDVLV